MGIDWGQNGNCGEYRVHQRYLFWFLFLINKCCQIAAIVILQCSGISTNCHCCSAIHN
jgi:hypothetical protein